MKLRSIASAASCRSESLRVGLIAVIPAEGLPPRLQRAFDDVAPELVHSATEPVTTRERLTYRARLRPAWEPLVWHLIEQTGYLRVVDGRISRLDLVCTGFHPQA